MMVSFFRFVLSPLNCNSSSSSSSSSSGGSGSCSGSGSSFLKHQQFLSSAPPLNFLPGTRVPGYLSTIPGYRI